MQHPVSAVLIHLSYCVTEESSPVLQLLGILMVQFADIWAREGNFTAESNRNEPLSFMRRAAPSSVTSEGHPAIDIFLFPPSLLQFCTTVRKIVCSRMSSYLSAMCGVGIMLYLGCVTPVTIFLTLLISFTIWMAA